MKAKCPECGGNGEFMVDDFENGYKIGEHNEPCLKCTDGIIEVELADDKLQYMIETSIPVRVWEKSIKATVKQQRAEFCRYLEDFICWVESISSRKDDQILLKCITKNVKKLLLSKYKGG